MQIRPMTRDDVPAALAVYHSVGWGDRSAELDFYLGRPDTALFVAEAGGEICGCGGATTFGRTGWVQLIAVHPEHSRNGAGRAVTEAAVQWLRDQGVTTVMLLASDMGRPVYERLGFRPVLRYGVIQGTGVSAGGLDGAGLDAIPFT